MAKLNGEDFKGLPGETLGALINDYLEDITDWERGVTENYKASYSAARNFVLPMNPPRFELGYAVRRFFAAHGITIKKAHVINLASRGNNSKALAQEKAENTTVEKTTRRRKRRRKPAEKKGE
jgi:poly(A) polymerase